VADYRVTLTEEKRAAFKKMAPTGKGAARKLLHARILLLTDQGEYGEYWSDALDVGR
jgi:hypothetical protein